MPPDLGEAAQGNELDRQIIARGESRAWYAGKDYALALAQLNTPQLKIFLVGDVCKPCP